jgi:hypothetical protein
MALEKKGKRRKKHKRVDFLTTIFLYSFYLQLSYGWGNAYRGRAY